MLDADRHTLMLRRMLHCQLQHCANSRGLRVSHGASRRVFGRHAAVPESGGTALVEASKEKEGPSTDFKVIWGRLLKVKHSLLPS